MSRQDQFGRRLKILWIVIICGLFVLLGRIAWLQLIEGERYFRISKNSRLRLVPLPCIRGLILDRNGEKLAGNEAFFSVGVVPSNVANVDELIERFDEFLDIDKEIAKKRIQEANDPFRPAYVKRNIDLSAVTYLLEKEEDFPGTVILTQPVRSYHYDEMCAHVLGHVGEVNQDELTANSTFGVEPGDLVGKMGVEKVYNSYLQGEKGGRQVEVDAHGRTLRVISEKDPLPGDSVYLTIDLEMQKIAAEKLGQRKGVVLIGDYETGEILALVSHPSFNPNLFSWGVSEDEWSKLVGDPGDPLENRALRGEYPPLHLLLGTTQISLAFTYRGTLWYGTIPANSTLCDTPICRADSISSCFIGPSPTMRNHVSGHRSSINGMLLIKYSRPCHSIRVPTKHT